MSNSKKKLVEQFLDFEEKLNLFEDSKTEVIWPIVRIKLYGAIHAKYNNYTEAHPKSRMTTTVINIIKSLWLAIIKAPIFLSHKDTIIFNHSRRIENAKGYYECKYTEHLVNINSYVFEAPFYNRHLPPENLQNLIYLDLLLNISRFYSLIKSKYLFNTRSARATTYLTKQIQKEFNIVINPLFINLAVNKYSALLFFANIILRKIKPSKIFMAVAYSDINLPFVVSARSQGIKVIEIQHGIMGMDHVAYNFKVKRNFYWFPDEVWVWNDFWREHSRFPIHESKIIIKGFPFLDRFKKSRKSTVCRKNIICISQGPYTSELVGLCLSLNKLIDNTKFQILYRPHPSELAAGKAAFTSLTKEGIGISTTSNIYEEFSRSDIQIGVNSTALFEGIEFGLTTFILKLNGWEVFEKNRHVFCIENAKEILIKLR